MSELYIRLGKALKAERQGKNLPLAQLAEQLKTSESTIERVEEGDSSSFSSPVYFTLYAKSYAEALGVDYARTLDAIRDDLGESAEPIAPASLSKPTAASPAIEMSEPSRKKKPLWIFIIVLVVVAVAVALWIALSGSNKTVVAPPVITTPDTAIASMVDSAAVQPSDTSVITLSLSARGSSWVALMNDGDTALYRTFSAGETLEVSAVRQMILTVGTPWQIDLKLNGHPVKLVDRSGRIANVVITPANVRAYTGVTDTTIQTQTVDSVDDSSAKKKLPGDTSMRPSGGLGR